MASDIQEELHQINLQLAPLADGFSYSLGQASRRAKSLLLWTMFVAATLLAAAALVVSRRLVRDSESLQQVLLEGGQTVQQLVQGAPFPMLVSDEKTGAGLYANDQALALFKTSLEGFLQAPPQAFYCRSADRVLWLEQITGQDRLHDWEMELKDIHGDTFWALVSVQRITYLGQKCLLTALNSIELRKRAQDILHHRAYHDELTGLPNRAMCMDALQRTLARCERKSAMFSILFIDLDHFKAVNDSLGHEAGDQLLLQVAQRITAGVRSGDLVARLGGDEFIVAIEEHHDLAEMSDIALKILSALEPAYLLSGREVRVTASIGISTYPQNGTDLQHLLTGADKAMYQAKGDGRNHVRFFTPT